MRHGISESDWKLFRQLRPRALDRFCQRVLDEVSRLTADTDKSSHERYLAVFKLLQQRDDELADTFNNPRRSTALLQLARMFFQELLTAEELACFSPDARSSVHVSLNMRQAEEDAPADRPCQ
jgi:hypothetical protein